MKMHGTRNAPVPFYLTRQAVKKLCLSPFAPEVLSVGPRCIPATYSEWIVPELAWGPEPGQALVLAENSQPVQKPMLREQAEKA
jgi:hypothetical protein